MRGRVADRAMVSVAAACVAMVLGMMTLTACEPAGSKRPRATATAEDIADTDAGLPRPGPDPAARPEYSNRVAASITVECTWHGRRWFEITVMHNGEPRGMPRRQVKYDHDGKSFAEGRGSFSETFVAEPGDEIGIFCHPMTDETPYFTLCRIIHHRAQVAQDGPTVDRNGVICAYKIPGGPR